MKKSFISLGLIVAATFALTNCAKELENPSQQPESAGIPFEITASTPDTKTANDGFNTVWVADDAVNVFHAEKGSTAYEPDGKFTLTSGTSFTGTISEELTADEYDWYVYYPYSNDNDTPAGTSSQNLIAQSSSGSQQQNGYDNMAHLSGNRFPMYGKATVAKDGDVSVSMNHLVALAEITVTNANTDPLLVTDVTFTSEQNIVGTFYVDFTGNEPDFAEGDNVSKTASLTVSNGTEIAKDGTAKFYIAFKPFTATAGQKLTIAVNGYSKEITLPADVEFKAGKIKKLNFGYDAPTVIYETAFDYAIVGSSYQSSSEIIGTDEGTTTSWGIVYGNWNSSNCAQMRVYSAGNFGYTYMKFDVSYVTSVSYSAKVSDAALKLNTYYSVDSGQTWTKVDNNKVLTTSLDEYSFIVSETGAYDKVRVKFEVAGDAPASKNYQLTIDDVKIYGKGEVLVDKDPTIIVENASVSVGASSVLAEFEYSLIDIDGEPSVSVTSDEYGIIVGEPSVSDGVVSINLIENTENIAKSATLTLSYTGADDVILTVNQAAYVDLSDQKAYAKVSSITSGETYLLVAEYSGGEYIFNGSSVAASTPSVDASIYKVDTKIVSNETTDKCAVVITSVGDNYTIKLSTGKYLVVNSSTSDTSNLSSSDSAEELSVMSKNGKFLFVSTNRDTRALVYRDGYNFKNYAVSNAEASGYCGYLTLYQLED